MKKKVPLQKLTVYTPDVRLSLEGYASYQWGDIGAINGDQDVCVCALEMTDLLGTIWDRQSTIRWADEGKRGEKRKREEEISEWAKDRKRTAVTHPDTGQIPFRRLPKGC